MNIRKAVITAAARGQRLYPVADTVQKAMLPIVDPNGINKPVIQIIAEEAFLSGIEEICIVCAPGDDKRYIESFRTLQTSMLKAYKNSEWAEKQAADIKNLLDRMSFTVQQEPKGYGNAVYQAKNFINGEPFLLLLGDYLYVSNLQEKRCAQQLIELAVKENCSVSAVNPTIEHLISKYGTVTGKALKNYKGVYQIEKIAEKPSVSFAELELQTPGLKNGYYLCFFGMHIFKPVLFDMLENYMDKNPGENVLLTPIQEQLANEDKYLALEMKGNRYDMSKKYGLMKAQIALGLSGKTREEIMEIMINLLAESSRI